MSASSPVHRHRIFPDLESSYPCTLHSLVIYDIAEANGYTQSKGFNYGFIEYDDPGAAERAMASLNGRSVHQQVRGAPLVYWV